MALRLDPEHPLVWRTPHSVQFGVERAVARIDDVGAGHELVIALLSRGVTRRVLLASAEANGMSAADVDGILDELGSLVRDADTRPAGSDVGALSPASLVVELDARPREADVLGPLLEGVGFRVRAPGSGRRMDAAVLVSHFATSPRRAARWLREDVPHLLVEFGDRSVRIGPFVVPGRGPCAECLELARVEADPAWPAMAAQLSVRTAPSADGLGVSTAGVVAARMLVEQFAGGGTGGPWSGRAVRILRPGLGGLGLGGPGLGPELGPGPGPTRGDALSIEAFSAHPSCGCRSPAGSVTAGGRPTAASRPPPTTDAVVVERA